MQQLVSITNNPKFFNPVASKNQDVYFDSIQKIIEFQVNSGSDMTEQTARAAIAEYIKSRINELETEPEEEDTLSRYNSLEQNLSRILKRFHSCGWLTEKRMGRNGEWETRVTPMCRRFVDFMLRSSNQSLGSAKSHVNTMHMILKSLEDETSMSQENPYEMVLCALITQMQELELTFMDMFDSIDEIHRNAMKINDAASLQENLWGNPKAKNTFDKFEEIRENGLANIQIFYICRTLLEIKERDTFSKMVSEYQEANERNGINISEQDASEYIENRIDEIFCYINNSFPDKCGQIITRLNEYNALIRKRIIAIRSAKPEIEELVHKFLLYNKDLPEDEKNESLGKVGACIQLSQQKYLSTAAFPRKKKKEIKNDSPGVPISMFSEDEIQEQMRKLKEKTKNEYSQDNVFTYIENFMKTNNEVTIKESDVKDKRDALMYSALAVFAQNSNSPYTIETTGKMLQLGFAEISEVKIRKKGKVG